MTLPSSYSGRFQIIAELLETDIINTDDAFNLLTTEEDINKLYDQIFQQQVLFGTCLIQIEEDQVPAVIAPGQMMVPYDWFKPDNQYCGEIKKKRKKFYR